MKIANFDYIFNPKSIAVLGASNAAGSVGKMVMDNLVWGNYTGKIFPVCQTPEQFPNLTTYPSVHAIDQKIELAVIIANEKDIIKSIKQTIEAGIKALILVSTGEQFSENTRDNIVKVSNDTDAIIIGPNSYGVINPSANVNLSKIGVAPSKGSVALVCDNGAICSGLLDLANANSIGISKVISLGDKIFSDLDLWQYLADDDQTKAIVVYADHLSPHSDWIESVRKITANPNHPKPIILLYNGDNDREIADAFCRQAGIIKAHDINQLFTHTASAMLNPEMKSADITVASNTEALTTLALSALKQNGLNVINQLEVKTDKDFVGLAKHLQSSALLITIAPQMNLDLQTITKAIFQLKKDHPHLAMSVCLIGSDLVRTAASTLRRADICVSSSPSESATQLKVALDFCQSSGRKITYPALPKTNHVDIDKYLPKKVTNKTTVLDSETGAKILTEFGLPIANDALAKTAIEATALAHEIQSLATFATVSVENSGGLVIDSMDHISESESSKSFDQIIKATKTKPDGKIDGVIVYPTQKAGDAYAITIKRDPIFGSIIHIKSPKKHETFISPISSEDAKSMKEYENIILQLEQIMLACPRIVEVGLEPIVTTDSNNKLEILFSKIVIN
ncbi:MAG: CoA-binding protein [Patescibacteria group bacterium]|jgi:acetyltransferase